MTAVNLVAQTLAEAAEYVIPKDSSDARNTVVNIPRILFSKDREAAILEAAAMARLNGVSVLYGSSYQGDTLIWDRVLFEGPGTLVAWTLRELHTVGLGVIATVY